MEIAALPVLIPLPSYGFDPTESAVPFAALLKENVPVVFATPEGKVAEADRRMVTGQDLPFLFKGTLKAEPAAVRSYEEMTRQACFQNPIAYKDIVVQNYRAILLPGGHDKGMREYLESQTLQNAIVQFFEANKPVGAICHGTLLAARSKKADGKSVLYGRKTTGLTQNQEKVAFWLTRCSLGDYYKTYDVLMADELISYLADKKDYDSGPGTPIPLSRDSQDNVKSGFVVLDGNYLSARWPGDAHRFAQEFVTLLKAGRPQA